MDSVFAAKLRIEIYLIRINALMIYHANIFIYGLLYVVC